MECTCALADGARLGDFVPVAVNAQRVVPFWLDPMLLVLLLHCTYAEYRYGHHVPVLASGGLALCIAAFYSALTGPLAAILRTGSGCQEFASGAASTGMGRCGLPVRTCRLQPSTLTERRSPRVPPNRIAEPMAKQRPVSPSAPVFFPLSFFSYPQACRRFLLLPSHRPPSTRLFFFSSSIQTKQPPRLAAKSPPASPFFFFFSP